MRFLNLVIVLFVLSGCESLSTERSLEGSVLDVVSDEASFWSLETNEEGRNSGIKRVDLLTELDPRNDAPWRIESTKSLSERLALALNGFYERHSEAQTEVVETRERQTGLGGPQVKARIFVDVVAIKLNRDRVQDRIIGASNLNCDAFKRQLLSQQSELNFWLGSAATTTAGLGAIFTDPATARGLSGAAAILSGVRGEYNNSFFRRLLAEVITRGINIERDTVYAAIVEKRKQSISDYTVEGAIADAIQYNAKCTLIAGLENAQKSQQFYDDPGLERLKQVFYGDSAAISALFAAVAKTEAAERAQPVNAASPATDPDAAKSSGLNN